MYNLIKRVINQMKKDIANDDWTAIEELLLHCTIESLEGFLEEPSSKL